MPGSFTPLLAADRALSPRLFLAATLNVYVLLVELANGMVTVVGGNAEPAAGLTIVSDSGLPLMNVRTR